MSSSNPAAQIAAFLVETGTNEAMRNENMQAKNVSELVAVANRYGFAFTPADMIRHQAKTILSFTDEELSLYTESADWWMLCLQAYVKYGK
jgi:predicted ribosomally synthesized peptide with nif11-like leader